MLVDGIYAVSVAVFVEAQSGGADLRVQQARLVVTNGVSLRRNK
jgi:hypothetical protein